MGEFVLFVSSIIWAYDRLLEDSPGVELVPAHARVPVRPKEEDGVEDEPPWGPGGPGGLEPAPLSGGRV